MAIANDRKVPVLASSESLTGVRGVPAPMSRVFRPSDSETSDATSSRVELVDAGMLDDLRQRLLVSLGDRADWDGVLPVTKTELGAILLSYGVLVRALRQVLSGDDPAARSEAEWILERIRGGERSA